MSDLVSTLDVDLHDEVPVLVGYIFEADIPEDTSVVEDDVNASESLDGSLDDFLAILDTVVVGRSLAARLFDFFDNYVGSLRTRWVSRGSCGM